ncbi:hypothetical protein FXE80_00865 [Vibrio cholerae]|uniref:hypothetical protein n=1 Tax=Vibrio cholerae TaxID=666 RepID=UPI0011DB6A7D|nr:hypothetical protein [Vibrio cholerae]TXY77937.1 hypothetical protein FXE80_00865 [Vibrio cholerae]GIB16551.1 hypothetical protein VCSRO90_2752 [Vibrio cholerae]
MNKFIISAFIFICISFTSEAALRVHKAVQSEVPETPTDFKPELDKVVGRGREESLQSAMESIVKNKMTVKFIDDSLPSMKVNWRSDNEPLQVLLTKMSRTYGLDIVFNSTAETIYIGVDTGQCDAHREASLFKTKKHWAEVGISQMPTLPIYLPVYIDASGTEWRLC